MLPRLLVVTLAIISLPLLAHARLAPSPAEAKPLAVGASVPSTIVSDLAGNPLDLAKLVVEKPTLLIFYRGSWCPYCNRHLAALAAAEPELLKLGFQILAISPDDSAGLAKMTEKNHLNYRLLSDRSMHAAGAFGLAFRVDPATVEKYRQWKIELAPVPDEPGARWLPVPAAYIIGRDGRVKFVRSDPDYKVRISTADLLAAAAAAAN